jgi:hypothetical protein
MKITLYIADRKMNQMMAAFDMCPAYKVFVSMIVSEVERVGTDSDEEFFKRLISLSRKEKDYWIPAISHNGVLYTADEIREISDGNHSVIIPKAVTA